MAEHVYELYADDDVQPGPVPAEVLQYFRRKDLKIGFDHRDVWNQEHDFAFTAAKVMRRDVLDALHDELAKAIEQGMPFKAFTKSIEPRLKALGWWEPQEVEDPKLGGTVTINPPARLRTIFNTNMRTARAVGQYDRIQRTKKTRPYLLYQVGPSAKHREQHLAWHGLLLPADDAFWKVAFPPNGYGCKCSVRSVSQREADRLERDGVLAPNPEPVLDDEGVPTGHVIEKRVPVVTKAPDLPIVPYLNTRTGVVTFGPEGIHPSFARPPGEARKRALQGV
jgi:uncharacterized protein with gpF-like domain